MPEALEQQAAQSQAAGAHAAPPEAGEQEIAHAAAGAASRIATPFEAALGRLIRRIRDASDAHVPFDGVAIESLSAPAFRALVAERLRSLERDTAEIRSRINGLLFVVAGAVVSQLVLRIVG